MQRLKARLSRRTTSEEAPPDDDSPEGNASRGVRRFCESSGPNSADDEVLHLPTIVDAAESSPLAAKEAANQIKKLLEKENYDRPHVQYNAIMLIRILADNPGKTFTRSLDAKFVSTVRDLLRQSRDPSVQQILRETLDTFATGKDDDESLKPLLDMWLREKVKVVVADTQAATFSGPRSGSVRQGHNVARQQNYFARNHRTKSLPSPHELAGRIEEAKTSANLLLQVVQSTPSSEILNNDLIAEFAQRCQSASRSVQAYIHSDDPVPDDDTLLTLIETNEHLSLAMSKHQRAVLQARKVMATRSTSAEPPVAQPVMESDPFADQPAPTDDPQATLQGPHDSYYRSGEQGDLYNDAPDGPERRGQRTSQLQDDPSKLPRRDESFRLTLPPQPPEPQEQPKEPEDLRWSWSQRLSTQTGYGAKAGQPTSQRQVAPQDLRHPGKKNEPPSLAQRQQSAVKNTTMRGGAGAEHDAVSPVSPMDKPPTMGTL
ncbi:MAG: hypothetical protein M1832_005031 [Thelocarpon impressellum]|nr:MAG: hypothetical protein M1832_005031 [Thelocarpon impressellum]